MFRQDERLVSSQEWLCFTELYCLKDWLKNTHTHTYLKYIKGLIEIIKMSNQRTPHGRLNGAKQNLEYTAILIQFQQEWYGLLSKWSRKHQCFCMYSRHDVLIWTEKKKHHNCGGNVFN